MQQALMLLGEKPSDGALQSEKKRYSELVSQRVAYAIAAELRERGLRNTRPSPPGEQDQSGAERRMAGGIGAKKVDVSWASEESGLLLGVSIKSINFRDRRTRNFQKNITNRRGDMLFESVTLHRRFPYAVLIGFLFLDEGAESDGTGSRVATFQNAHDRLKLFTGRDDPAGREEQYERLFVVLLNADSRPPRADIFRVGDSATRVSLDSVLDEAVQLVVDRNPDFYAEREGRLIRVEQAARGRSTRSDQEVDDNEDTSED